MINKNTRIKIKTIKKILFEQNQIGLIVVDYLQLMQNSKLKNEITFSDETLQARGQFLP